MEIQKKNETGIISIIAFDRFGRKFTNCTSVNAQFELKGEGILEVIEYNLNYQEIKNFVQGNKDLMFLKQQFDENTDAVTIADLKPRVPIT